jgi:NDP-sugar pyrophosphorylase family protein
MTRTEDGLLDEMQEKPVNTYLINTGMYILEPDVLDLVPDDSFFHITELIAKVKDQGKRVGIFPISEGSWKDIGEWPEYLKNYVNL